MSIPWLALYSQTNLFLEKQRQNVLGTEQLLFPHRIHRKSKLPVASLGVLHAQIKDLQFLFHVCVGDAGRER